MKNTKNNQNPLQRGNPEWLESKYSTVLTWLGNNVLL
jgi:hypothetical protein